MTRGARGALVTLGGYGLTMVMAGVALAVGPGETSPPSAAGRDEPAAESVSAESWVSAEAGVSPSTGPSNSPTTLPSGSTAGAAPSGIPTARQATAAPGQQVAFVPSGLRLPNGTRAPVIPVGVAADGALEIPENPAEVGVWNGGARAGDTLGSLVIAGHVDSRVYGLGVLHELKGVRPGALIELSDGDRRQRYTVTSTRYVNQQSLATDDEFFRQDVDARLVVITCGGPFDAAKRRYRDNYIVLATPA